MPKRKGVIYNLTFASQKIDGAISSLNGKCFTQKEIREMTGVNKNDVNTFLIKKTEKGLLERIKHDCYRKVSDKSLTERLPNAFVATKVWRVLCQSDKLLTSREISKIIEEETGYNCYSSIGRILLYWYRRGAIDKIGAKKPYAYQIKPDYYGKDRPLASPLF